MYKEYLKISGLQGTTADVKNNLLFEEFKINYNDLPQIFRKGSVIYRKKVETSISIPQCDQWRDILHGHIVESRCLCQESSVSTTRDYTGVRFRVNSWSLNWQLTRPGFLQVEEVVKVENGEDIKRPRVRVAIEHEDIIRDNFWTNHPYILSVASNHRHVVHRSPTSWMTYLEHILEYFIHC